MRKLFSLIAAVLFAGSMMAESYTITFKSTEGADATASLTSTTVSDYVASGAEYVSAISASGKVYNGQAGYGLKFGNSSSAGAVTMTLTTPVAPTSIVMNASPWSATEGSGLLQDSVFATKSTGAKGTFADFTYVYDGATQVTTIIVGTSTKRGYVKSVTVNYESGVTPPAVATPVISGDIEFTDSVIVTITCSTPEADIYYTIDGVTDPKCDCSAAPEYKKPIVIKETTTIMAAAYTGNDWSAVATKTFTKKEKLQPITCLEVYQKAKNDAVLLNPVTVTYSNGANVWVMDGSASMLIYLPSGFTNNFQAGDVLSGIAGVVDIYQNIVYEVKPDATQAAAIVATPGEAPAPSQHAVIEASDVNQYVILPGFSIEGAFTSASKTSLPAALGTDTVTIYNNFKLAYTFEAGKTYDIIGVVSAYKGNPQVYFISATESTATAIDNAAIETKAIKMIKNGMLVIKKGGKLYNVMGTLIK